MSKKDLHPEYPCFTVEQFALWSELAATTRFSDAEHPTPCSDCTKAYQAEMSAAGRCCNAHGKVGVTRRFADRGSSGGRVRITPADKAPRVVVGGYPVIRLLEIES